MFNLLKKINALPNGLPNGLPRRCTKIVHQSTRNSIFLMFLQPIEH